ncbi:hypothetical protein BDZ90DRAFT_262912 [Jaminaea rosea]|uniref:Uncharacterized protein n=1 Tax=Jaminaea rosea TaxID=1569628 RepID=A0A316UK03_9BASI|nr:hypothetical protein BDZ90DRAFT_262912 [Jaminaea rosea]PWN24691.1 hypothetical protein BDZ90DRAFT_262912 [Jaminaea rosea]
MSKQPPNRRRRRPDALAIFGAAGAAVALVGAGYYWYSQWAASGSKKEADPSSSAPTSTASSSQAFAQRPTLSLTVPASLPSSSISHLYTQVVTPLAQQYNIHLILPSTLEALPESTIDGLDTRRILRYSTSKGAYSVARALGCNAHVELLAGKGEDHGDDDGGDDDESYKALQLIRKNGKCRLLVMVTPPKREGFSASLTSEGSGQGAALRIIPLPSHDAADWKRITQRLTEYRSAWR